MNTVFEVPCPVCARPMSLAGDGNLMCPSCRRCYRLRMGHLLAMEDRPAALPNSAGACPAGPTSSGTS